MAVQTVATVEDGGDGRRGGTYFHMPRIPEPHHVFCSISSFEMRHETVQQWSSVVEVHSMRADS